MYTPRRFRDPGGVSRETRVYLRELESAIQEHDRALYRTNQGDDNANKGQNSSMSRLAQTVAELPLPVAYAAAQKTPFGLSDGPKTIQVLIPIPRGKTQVVLTAIGNVAVLDQTSGGVAVANASIEADGNGFVFATPFITASKDAGASKVNNILTPALGFQRSGLNPSGAESILVAMTVNASNLAPFTSTGGNYATLTVTAIFFN